MTRLLLDADTLRPPTFFREEAFRADSTFFDPVSSPRRTKDTIPEIAFFARTKRPPIFN
ncbi:hypothetical protein J2P12_06575 [Candidatus Bathyarchaeota archaeon]|nr:hypothetical protein [Candidatus Bathyarchaeota archaeon]